MHIILIIYCDITFWQKTFENETAAVSDIKFLITAIICGSGIEDEINERASVCVSKFERESEWAVERAKINGFENQK